MTKGSRRPTRQDIERGVWAKPWGGQLAHLFLPGGMTLCGKGGMIPHRNEYHDAARRRCSECDERFRLAQLVWALADRPEGIE